MLIRNDVLSFCLKNNGLKFALLIFVTGKEKSKTFLSEEELADWSLKFKLNEEEKLSVPTLSSSKVFYTLGDAKKTSDKVKVFGQI